MKSYAVMLKKELVGNTRTYKLFVMMVVFAIFGFMNPLFAKVTPQLMQVALPEVEIAFPEPTAFDSWTQFFKNNTQMGMIVLAIVFSGIVCNELAGGTLVNLLTKGLSRVSVIWAKFTGMVLIWTASWAICLGITWGYTIFLFPGDSPAHILFSSVCMWLFGVFLLATLTLASTLAKSSYVSLLLTGAVIVLAVILNIPAFLQRYNPMALAGQNMALLQAEVLPGDLLPAMLVTALISLALVTTAAVVFRKKQL